MEEKFIICHYAEIALKGLNRKFFEQSLIENIKKSSGRAYFRRISRVSGRILIELKQQAGEKDKDKIIKSLKNIFGIANFSFAFRSKRAIQGIKSLALFILKDKDFKTFAIRTKRSEKDFYLKSQEVNELVGSHILENIKGKKVDLENAQITCFIEIVGKFAFLYTKKHLGLGGLPVGVSGRAVSLISGGIDSPVASFLVIKRGVKLTFVHFCLSAQSKGRSMENREKEKIKEIVKVLNKYQFRSKLYFVPFYKGQAVIFEKAKKSLYCVLCKRLMIRLAQSFAEKENADALVCGDSIGQVASQTLSNIRTISLATTLPILRPLAGADKQEIINMAKKIGTFDISTMPCQKYCEKFLPKHPKTKTTAEEVEEEENKLDIDKIIKGLIKETELLII